MVVVKVELWPLGDESRKVQMGRLEIRNDLTGTATRGNYLAIRAGRYTAKVRETRVTGYRRKSSPVWRLITMALVNMGYMER